MSYRHTFLTHLSRLTVDQLVTHLGIPLGDAIRLTDAFKGPDAPSADNATANSGAADTAAAAAEHRD